MNKKEQIRKLIKEYPKHFSKMIKNNHELLSFLEQESLIKGTIPEMVVSLLYNDTNICKYGYKKKYKSVNHTFGFCGKTKVCQCAKESVSYNVSLSKRKRTKEEIDKENTKRENTLKIKFGIDNAGKLPQARKNHKKVYEDLVKKEHINTKIKDTKLSRYGSKTFNNRNKAKQTMVQKYNVSNPLFMSKSLQNPNLSILRDKEKLTELFNNKTVQQIADELNVHVQTVYSYLRLHNIKTKYQSSFEQEICNFLRSLGVENILTNSRKIISKEIDIYLPDYKLAIEYNGEYWHHIDIPHIDKLYHYNKFIECEKNGITLFTIFGESWRRNKEQWKAKIQHKLNLAEKRIYARNCQIVSLTTTESNSFLNSNHIQGGCVSQYRYGLTHNDELVAVMTFSKPRTGIGKKRENAYELVRYSTSCSVVGGASKLLNYFSKTHNPKNVISYSDNRYSAGELYKKLGFSYDNETKCGYFYYDPVNKKTYHRFNFTKHKLIQQGFDANKTEREIMRELGYLRIYDCGSRTWIKQYE